MMYELFVSITHSYGGLNRRQGLVLSMVHQQHRIDATSVPSCKDVFAQNVALKHFLYHTVVESSPFFNSSLSRQDEPLSLLLRTNIPQK